MHVTSSIVALAILFYTSISAQSERDYDLSARGINFSSQDETYGPGLYRRDADAMLIENGEFDFGASHIVKRGQKSGGGGGKAPKQNGGGAGGGGDGKGSKQNGGGARGGGGGKASKQNGGGGGNKDLVRHPPPGVMKDLAKRPPAGAPQDKARRPPPGATQDRIRRPPPGATPDLIRRPPSGATQGRLGRPHGELNQDRIRRPPSGTGRSDLIRRPPRGTMETARPTRNSRVFAGSRKLGSVADGFINSRPMARLNSKMGASRPGRLSSAFDRIGGRFGNKHAASSMSGLADDRLRSASSSNPVISGGGDNYGLY